MAELTPIPIPIPTDTRPLEEVIERQQQVFLTPLLDCCFKILKIEDDENG